MPETIDCEQGSREWLHARLGIPTASNFPAVLAKGKKGAPSVTRKRYMRRLVAERFTGEPHETYGNVHMERGQTWEAEARTLYAYAHDVQPWQVGFVKNGQAGWSPDSLVGEIGAVEIKTALPEIIVEKIEADKFPPEHVAQCQGGLWVGEREWIDLLVYWPGMPVFEKRAYRDEDYIKTIAEEVECFNEELSALLTRICHYGMDRPFSTDKAATVRGFTADEEAA